MQNPPFAREGTRLAAEAHAPAVVSQGDGAHRHALSVQHDRASAGARLIGAPKSPQLLPGGLPYTHQPQAKRENAQNASRSDRAAPRAVGNLAAARILDACRTRSLSPESAGRLHAFRGARAPSPRHRPLYLEEYRPASPPCPTGSCPRAFRLNSLSEAPTLLRPPRLSPASGARRRARTVGREGPTAAVSV